MSKITIWTDGCCEPINPGGHAGYGAVIFKDGDRISEHSGYIPAAPNTSNNVGEYKAIIWALRWLRENADMKLDTIELRTDSMMAVKQLNGKWRIKQGHYVPFAFEAKQLMDGFKNLSFIWVSRDDNEIADELSKRELKKRNVTFKIQPWGK